jgi:murein DD-endopeptidase MepM/ murein hydrolase activator NlpD
MRTSRILTVLFALLLALSSLTSGTPIAAAEELGPTSIAVDSNNVAAVSRMQAISTDETNAYVDDAYGFSLRVPDTWHIRPASAERLGSVTQISNVARDELGSDSDTTGIIKREVGVFTYDKPLDTPITEWTKSGDNLPQTEPVDHEITIADQDALRRDFQSDLWSGSMIMVPYGTKVYFVSITPLSSLTDRDVVTMLDSFKIVTPFEMDQPLVENLYKGPTSSSLVESTDEASQITATAGYRLPFVGTYRITAGPGCYDTHVNRSAEAIDFGLGLDTPVYTPNSGTIVFAVYGTPDNDYNDGFGNLMKVQHQDGKISWYAHLNSFTKTSGSISQEEQIAYSGNTGNVTGPHLHFEIRDGTNYSISIRDLPGITWYNGNPANPCIDGDDGIAVGPPVSGGTSCAAPHLTSPDNGATVDSRTVTFHWDAPDCPGLTGYTIHVTTGSGPEDGIILDSAASLTEYSYTFPSDGTYYWHVAAWSNGTVRGPWADYRIVVSTSTPVNQWSARYYDNGPAGTIPAATRAVAAKRRSTAPNSTRTGVRVPPAAAWPPTTGWPTIAPLSISPPGTISSIWITTTAPSSGSTAT